MGGAMTGATNVVLADQAELQPVETPPEETSCCVVGGGPAGAMLALLLARQGVPVKLLEVHKDFEREFRGDTVHPSTLEILDEIGLADRLVEMRHERISRAVIQAADGPFAPLDLRRLKTKFPYIMLMHQARFIEFLVAEAGKYPEFQLVMGANVQHLVEREGAVRGVRYLAADGWHEVHAVLTVGADGRFSMVRKLAGIEPIRTSPPMDVLWFRLPHLPEDPSLPGGAAGGVGRGHLLVIFDRHDYWQVGYVIPKGHYQEVRAAGLGALRQSLAEMDARFAPHVEHLTDWHQFSLLSVESSWCRQWYKPGVLLIGDAAHAMSPVGGVGINYAIQDAVVAANVLGGPLRAGQVALSDLAEVQRQRQWPTRFIQTVQTIIQKRLLARVILRSREKLPIPWYVRLFFKIPVLRDLPPRTIAFGVKRVHVRNTARHA